MIVQTHEEMEKELVALRAFVEQCAGLLKCGGATVPSRIEQELKWRSEDRNIKSALYSRIEAARKTVQDAIAEAQMDVTLPSKKVIAALQKVLEALEDVHAQA